MGYQPFCVCYCFNQNYIVQACASLESLCKNNDDLDSLDIYAAISCEDQTAIKQLREIADRYRRPLTILDAKAIIRKAGEKYHFQSDDPGSIMIVRYLIGSFLPEKYENVLYVDVDTLVLGSIKPVTEMQNEYAVMAVMDTNADYSKALLGFKVKEPYYNCGILLINLPMWRKQKCEERYFHHYANIYNKYIMGDQDILNLELKGEIGTLDLKYNTFPLYPVFNYKRIKYTIGRRTIYYSSEEYRSAQQKPVILHLVGIVQWRPWELGNKNPYSETWMHYVQEAGLPAPDLQDPKRHKHEVMKRRIFDRCGSWAYVIFNRLVSKRAARGWLAKQYKKDNVGAWRNPEGTKTRISHSK